MAYYDDWDPSILVLYDYDKKEDVPARDAPKSWEYCDGDYAIVLTALKIFDTFEEAVEDMNAAFNAAKKAKVCKVGDADHLKRKRRLEVYPHGDSFRFRLFDKNDKLVGICVRDYPTFEKAWNEAEGISKNIGKSVYHYLNYAWHEDHPRVDKFRRAYLKNGE